ncbi:hypothetical protein F4777DRAFT_598333 [Nemania sp. FL0916]|nr:hypothetical protein F4777DRAFT_598333 [Nemania sp. FL0916]
MQHRIVIRLSALLATWPFVTGALAVPRPDTILKPEFALTAGDEFKRSASVNSSDVVTVTEMVTVTVTSADVDLLEMSLGGIDGFGSPIFEPISPTESQREMFMTVYVTQPNAYTYSSASGYDSIEILTMLSPDVVTMFQHASSTSSQSEDVNADPTTTTTTQATVISASSPTSTFDAELCDDVFCNTDGSMICMYWGGFTSWDVSRGPMPGERPTVIGTC